MNSNKEGQKESKKKRLIRLHTYRKFHRRIGVILSVFLFIIATTGLLLGWKDYSGGILKPDTLKGSQTNMALWLPTDSLAMLSQVALKKHHPELSQEIDRIDVRPSKGMMKFRFKGHYKGVQIDAATGVILAITQRNHDLIEQIHDGSILVRLTGLDTDFYKLTITGAAGLALLYLSTSGIWLWLGPKVLRKKLNSDF